MLLRLAPAIATGRALFAAAVVMGSSVGHFTGEHAHAQMPTITLAFFVLLATAWRTNNPRTLFLAALSVQVMIHFGGVATAHVTVLTPSMVMFHAGMAITAWLLLWHFEAIWHSLSSALQAVLHAIEIAAQAPPLLIRVLTVRSQRVLADLLDTSTHPHRGPPVLA